MSATTVDAGWAGYWRPQRGVPWTRIASGDSYDDAWGRTLDALAPVKCGDTVVLRLDVDPNGPPARAERRRRR